MPDTAQSLDERVFAPFPEDGPNQYLVRPYGPVTKEIADYDLKVEGEIPAELDGVFVRNGPNPVFVDDVENHHWFLGHGMLHGVKLESGQAKWYKNKYIRTDEVTDALGEKRTSGPRRGLSDVVNTSIQPFAGKLWALIESGPYPMVISPDLDSIATDDFNGTLEGSWAAHPHLDPVSNDWIALTYDAADPKDVRLVEVAPNGEVKRSIPVPGLDGPMLHDFAFTQTYVVILDLPCVWNEEAAAEGHIFPYFWDDNRPARIGLLPRSGDTDSIVWIPCDPCAVFHVGNAFDEDGKVIIDLVVHEKAFDQARNGPGDGIPMLKRWTLDPASKTMEVKALSGAPLEFPKIDDRLFSLKHRYVYATGFGPGATGFNGFVRYDTETDADEFYEIGENCLTASEAIFVPRENAKDETDGWLIAFTYNQNTDLSDLIILDAQNFGSPPVAVVHLPQRVPMGFHACWCPSSAID